MKIVTIFDTSIATTNLGDQIILDSVKRELKEIFDEDTMFLNLPTHERVGRTAYKLMKRSDFTIVAGTNLLTSKYRIVRSKPWKANILDSLFFKNVILMGTGWANYEGNISLLQKTFYKNALSKDNLHSVRDKFSEEKLKTAGFSNVTNTACPTMWRLTSEHCSDIPIKKAKNVVTTLTDYRKDVEKDKQMLEILLRNYENVYFWVQGSKDYEYIDELDLPVKIISPSLESYDKILDSEESLDYIGTRLHAGIRALQKKRRSLIIGIDNRAKEKEKDFNLNVLDRNNLNRLESLIHSDIETNLTIDFEAIKEWKNQFQ